MGKPPAPIRLWPRVFDTSNSVPRVVENVVVSEEVPVPESLT
jgi:hypothetical protein